MRFTLERMLCMLWEWKGVTKPEELENPIFLMGRFCTLDSLILASSCWLIMHCDSVTWSAVRSQQKWVDGPLRKLSFLCHYQSNMPQIGTVSALFLEQRLKNRCSQRIMNKGIYEVNIVCLSQQYLEFLVNIAKADGHMFSFKPGF